MKINTAPLTIIALEDNVTVLLKQQGTVQWVGSYSLDAGNTWTSYTLASSQSLSKGQYISFKGTLSATTSSSNTLKFGISGGAVAVNGNLMSLTYESDFSTRTSIDYEYNFGFLFSDNDCVSSLEDQGLGFGEFILPATILTEGCYSNLFIDCSGLSGLPPELPATNLPSYCYDAMFYHTNIKLYAVKSGKNRRGYRIPTSGTATGSSPYFMMTVVNKDGSTLATPSLNTTYYLPADYAINKVIYNDETLVDLTSSTVTAAGLLKGTFAYDADGYLIEGTRSEIPYVEGVGITFENDYASLSEIETLPSLDLTNVYSMDYMFAFCSSLKNADFSILPNFNTSNTVRYRYMFYQCTSLQEIVFGDNFVVPMDATTRSMFSYCSSLKSLDLTGWGTSNAANMFSNCTSLQSVDFTDFTLGVECISLAGMFYNCTSLTSLKFDPDDKTRDGVTKIDSMFYNCTALTDLYVSIYAGEVTKMSNMFMNCSSLTSLDMTNIRPLTKVTDMGQLFAGCSKLATLKTDSDFGSAVITNMRSMFFNCNALTSIDLSNFDTTNVTDMYAMFYKCQSLSTLTLGSSFYTSNVTDMTSMFDDCQSLTSLDLSSFNTQNVTKMGSMFFNCYKLTTLDLSGFNTQNVTNMSNMFKGCKGLTELDLSKFNTSKVTTMNQMFNAYYSSGMSYTSLDLSTFDTSNVTSMYYMFSYNNKLTSLDLSNFNTSNVTDMRYMFSNCSSLTSLDLSSFDFTKVTEYSNMLYNVKNCTIYVKDATAQTFITSKVKPDSTCTVVIKS